VIKAIREDEDAVRSLGKNTYWYKMQSLTLGAIFGALSGFVFACGQQSINPDNYSTLFTFTALTALVLGGRARVLGPIVGAMLFNGFLAFTDVFLRQAIGEGYIPDWLIDSNKVGAVRFMLVGVALMALMIFRPQGIFGDKREVAISDR
jgi:branched-chain amino acid transport system permease protein